MNILFVFILKVILVSYVRSDPLPGVACTFLGTDEVIPHKKIGNVADVPDRCTVVIFDVDNFNEDPSKEDSAAMAALKAAGKTLYMSYGSASENWPDILADSKQLDGYIAPMLAYLKKNNIEGLILGFLNIHQGVISDYDTKIKTLIGKIKQSLPTIKIGLQVDGADCVKFQDKSVFDFTVTNPVLDFYAVDIWRIGALCVANSHAEGGVQPITSTDPKVISLEKLLKATTDSTMDKSKLVIYLPDFCTLMGDLSEKSYSDFCSRTGNDLWCADTSQLLYDKVIYFKKDFKGLMIRFLELDDTTNACGCEKFPVANTYIDAWEGKPMKNCAAFC